MKYLDSEIMKVNEKLLEGISQTAFSAGLTYQVLDKGNNAIIDKDGATIHVDDLFDVYFYHRLRSKSYSQATSHGLVNKHRADANVDVIVFSKIDAIDYFESKLNEYPTLKINSSDFDAYRIFRSETQQKEHDFNKYFIFSINYTLSYYPGKCLEL
jgi:hypothetical protein